MDELISIVIPIYNVEKYLRKCIDSIIGQTYKNLEIILVDDGSPDNCGKICDEYAKRDNRIKVIHKENGGLSDARNAGINIANGEYICFIDSDDYIEKNYIKFLYNAIKKDDVLIAQCGINIVDEDGKLIKNIGYTENKNKSGKIIIFDTYNGHNIENTVVWNKMYSIDLFKTIRYPLGKIHEDEYTTYKILYPLKKISIISDYLYNYRQNINSIMKNKFNIKRLDVFEAYEERMNFFLNKKEMKLYSLTLLEYLKILRNNYIKVKKNIKDSKALQKSIVKKYRKNFCNMIFNFKYLLSKVKISFLVFYISPNLYCYLLNKKLKG